MTELDDRCAEQAITEAVDPHCRAVDGDTSDPSDARFDVR